MTLAEISPDDLSRLARLMARHGLSELRYERDGVSLLLRAAPDGTSVAAAPPAALPSAAATPAAVSKSEYIAVDAPISGTFYRAAAPGEPPLVEIGSRVEEGQPIGLIEAMKVFSEVLSDKAGVVRAISAKDTAPIKAGAPLLLLEVE